MNKTMSTRRALATLASIVLALALSLCPAMALASSADFGSFMQRMGSTTEVPSPDAGEPASDDGWEEVETSGITVTPASTTAAQGFVYDEVGLLTAGQASDLKAMAADVAARHDCDVAVAVVEDYRDYAYGVESASEAFYQRNGLGFGDDGDCVMLFLSMDDRDYDILAHGAVGNAAFTDYGKYAIADDFKRYFRDDDWFGGMCAFVTDCDSYLASAEAGAPVDVNGSDAVYQDSTTARDIPGMLGASLLAGLGIGGGVAFGRSRGFKTVREAANAHHYMDADSLDMTQKTDQYLRTTHIVVPLPKHDDDDHGGGFGGFSGGTTISSGGFSHSSGKF